MIYPMPYTSVILLKLNKGQGFSLKIS